MRRAGQIFGVSGFVLIGLLSCEQSPSPRSTSDGTTPVHTAQGQSVGSAPVAAPCASTPKRYYVTKTDFYSWQAPTACDTGFHFAAAVELWQILANGGVYDKARGYTTGDMGYGPPAWDSSSNQATPDGWIRSGAGSDPYANCRLWTSRSAGDKGSYIRPIWRQGIYQTATAPWLLLNESCTLTLGVWCAED